VVGLRERHPPGITPEDLEAAGVRAKSCCEEMESEETDVPLIRTRCERGRGAGRVVFRR